MKTSNSKLFLLFFIFICSLGWSQNASIIGLTIDQESQKPMVGVSIEIIETGFHTTSNQMGEFHLYTKSGNITIKASYLGYEQNIIKLNLKDNERKIITIELETTIQELRGVTVTGQSQGQAKALNQQKNADNIVNIIAADQIGRFPDPNAAEALQRVSGVNIQRDQGEGRYVFVRGLAPQFTNISVNGEQIPSPEADVRFVALDAIPADQLASMEVYKTLTPDLDGDAVGGSINLITRVAESNKMNLSGSAVSGYNALMNKANIQGSLQYDKRFLNNKLGVLINASYYHNDLGSDNIENNIIDNEFEIRDYELTRTRRGLSATFDYRFNPNHTIYLKGLSTEFTDREWRRRYVFLPEDGEIERLTKDRFESQSVNTINVGGKNIFKKFTLDYDIQYALGYQDTPFDQEAVFIGAFDYSIDNSNYNNPVISNSDYLNNSAYEFDELEMGSTFTKDQNIAARLNFTMPYNLGKYQGILKAGAKIRSKSKNLTIENNKFEALTDLPTLDNFEGGLWDQQFFNNSYALGNPLDLNSLIGYYNQNAEQFELSIEDKLIDEAVEAFQAKESVYAGYLMARQQINKLTLTTGVRYEYTTGVYNSSDVVIAPNGDLQEIRPVTGEVTYGFLLPSLNLKYGLNSSTNLRAAVSSSYSRPNFGQIVPSQEANLEDNEASVGNPALKPVRAINYDLLAEHYFGNIGVLSGGVFYKSLTDFIYTRSIFNSQYPLNTPNPIATGILVRQAQNGETAQLLGMELNFQRKLNFLPGVLSYTNVLFNYTYTKSAATLQSREADEDNPNLNETIVLPGSTTHMGNIALAYDKQKLSLRLAMNYNGAYLSEVGDVSENDLYVKARLQLDVTASYTINKHFRVFVEGLNLTNQPFETYMGDQTRITQREFYSWWTRAGIKFKF
jgi:TonB-dependent receptor